MSATLPSFIRRDGIDKQRVRQLVDALRSGAYEQGKYRLHLTEEADSGKTKMCCLGVACDISGIGAWQPAIGKDHIESHPYLVEGGGQATQELPDAVKNWYGFNSSNPYVLYKGSAKRLSALNDQEVPFSEIANLIEATYLTEGENE
jgi:hypothetical protein